MSKIILIAFLVATVISQSCGGNCASPWCRTCDCGETPSYPDLDKLCGKYAWNWSCCKCLIKSISKGNTNMVRGFGW